MFSCCKLKTIQVVIKFLVRAVAILHSNMHIKFQVDRLLVWEFCTTATSKTWFREKRVSNLIICSKQHKKNSVSILN